MAAVAASLLHRIPRHPVLDAPGAAPSVEFRWDGRPLLARPSEMISSALFANGVQVFGWHRRDGSPQGLFCANGQCAQCLVLADGLPVKACVTAVRPGMDVRSLDGLPSLRADDRPLVLRREVPVVETGVLIVGGGPAGLEAAAELGAHQVPCILCDDKQVLGGKLSLQTHNFFGSVTDCHAGQRGTQIGELLERQARAAPSVETWTDAPVVGVFEGGYVGVVRAGHYTLVRPERMLVATIAHPPPSQAMSATAPTPTAAATRMFLRLA